MKKLLLLLSVMLVWTVHSQDTLSRALGYNGTMSYTITEDKDTFNIQTLDEVILAKISRRPNSNISVYTRYYPDGKIMWSKELVNNKSQGNCKYFNSRGKLVAEFTFENDSIIDTLFLSKKKRLLFGNITYTSVMHGGMMREDGSSNISRSSGIRPHMKMYAVKMDENVKTQSKYCDFSTDFRGEFFLCLEDGSFGFFDERTDISLVQTNFGTAQGLSGMSVRASWNLRSPYIINKKCYNFLNLHYSSVAYAP